MHSRRYDYALSQLRVTSKAVWHRDSWQQAAHLQLLGIGGEGGDCEQGAGVSSKSLAQRPAPHTTTGKVVTKSHCAESFEIYRKLPHLL